MGCTRVNKLKTGWFKDGQGFSIFCLNPGSKRKLVFVIRSKFDQEILYKSVSKGQNYPDLLIDNPSLVRFSYCLDGIPLGTSYYFLIACNRELFFEHCELSLRVDGSDYAYEIK